MIGIIYLLIVASQGYGEINLTGNNNTIDPSKLLLPEVSPEGNNILLTWQDNSTSNQEIFLRKSTNGGISFENTTNISNNTGLSSSPQIESFGNSTFVVWEDNSTGNQEIFLRKSTNGGISFENTTNISNNTGLSSSPQIESFGNSTFVVWEDNSTGNQEIFLRKSTWMDGDVGDIMENTTNISNNTGLSSSPQIESFGNSTFVVWEDNSTGNQEIFLRKSTWMDGDVGDIMENTTNISNNTGLSSSPQIESFGNSTFVVWEDNSTGNQEIFLRKSTWMDGDVGDIMENTTNISNNTGLSSSPQIESFGNSTFVVWEDNSTGNQEIFLRKSTNGKTVFYDLKDIRELNLQYKNGPILSDSNLRVELVATGLNFPTSMAFLGADDILVLEKNEGKVMRIVNGNLINNSLLDVNVGSKEERGMLGIATSKHHDEKDGNETVYVFLYYTESSSADGDDAKGQYPNGNRLYRYEFVDNKLTHPKLLLDLPAEPDTVHNGGKIAIGPDNNVYIVIGDLTRDNKENLTTVTKAENHEEGLNVDGRSSILRITQNGKTIKPEILGDTSPMERYYFAYGIRNSFGITFDPASGKLWDTESGPEFGDEINLVDPGFNSGWNKVQGIWEVHDNYPGNVTMNPAGLYNFGNKGHYSVPEFTWFDTSTGPTSLIFMNSSKLGSQNLNNLFVGGFHDGNIYRFMLDKNRTSLLLESPLDDKVANNKNETQSIIFGQGFGGITDLKVGPDGYLYILSLYSGGDDCGPIYQPGNLCISYTKPLNGAIFRIVPQ